MFGEHLGDGVVTTHPSESKRKRRGDSQGRGENFGGRDRLVGRGPRGRRNTRNPMVGSTVQQTCRVEEA